MKRTKDLKACDTELKALQARGDIGSEQKTAIGLARARLRKLGRQLNPSKREVFRCVREVTELLLKAFKK